jgi:hypothetical protein
VVIVVNKNVQLNVFVISNVLINVHMEYVEILAVIFVLTVLNLVLLDVLIENVLIIVDKNVMWNHVINDVKK